MIKNKKTTIGVLGCGWLGFPLAKKLLAEGYRVHGTTSRLEKIDLLEKAGIKPHLVTCKEDDCTSARPFLKVVDVVIVTIPPGLRTKPNRRYDTLIETLIQELVSCAVAQVIFISSTSVYGNQTGLLNETTPTKPVSESGKQLVKSEELLLKTIDFQTTVIRFGGLIGPERHPIFSLTKKASIPNPRGKINMIHLTDCINMISSCIQQSKGNTIYNGVSPYHPERGRYYREMAKMAGVSCPSFEQTEGIDRRISAKKIQSELNFNFSVENLLTLN